MANELNITGLQTGLTLTGQVFSLAGVQQGLNVSMSEVSSSQYSGTFDVSTLADGEYSVKFNSGSDIVGSGKLYIREGEEISQYLFSTIYDEIVGANA